MCGLGLSFLEMSAAKVMPFVGPLLFITVIIFFLVCRHKTKKNGKKIATIVSENHMINCPVCHTKISLEADVCPNCGKKSRLSELKKKKKCADIIFVILFLLLSGAFVFSGIVDYKTEERKEELEEEIKKMESAGLLDSAIHILENFEKQGAIDTIKGKDPVIDEYNACVKKIKVCEYFAIGELGLFFIVCVFYAIFCCVNSSKSVKYLDSVLNRAPTKMNVVPQKTNWKCIKCGTMNSSDSVFCCGCGTKKINDSPIKNENVPQRATVNPTNTTEYEDAVKVTSTSEKEKVSISENIAQTTEETLEDWYCIKCGTKNPSDGIFCCRCGCKKRM